MVSLVVELDDCSQATLAIEAGSNEQVTNLGKIAEVVLA